MPSDKAFLQAILENSEDDVPRLVYADWLEEHGEQDRADFIRTQIELARLPEYELRWFELRRRERALLDRHETAWRQPLQSWARPGSVFRRGFVGEVWCALSQFLRGGQGLLRRAPVRDLVLRQANPNQLLDLAGSPLLEQMQGLRLTSGCRLTLEVLRGLAASPHTGSLSRLHIELHFQENGQEVADSIASSRHLDHLTHLDLGGWADLGDEGAFRIATAPFFPHLTTLRLNNNQIGRDGAWILVATPRQIPLTTLGLTVQQIDGAATPLLASALQPGLWELDLRHNRRLGDAGIVVLADTPALSGLEVLRLSDCSIGPAGAQALARSPYLKELRHLVLCKNPIEKEGALALASSPHLENLTILNLIGCRLPIEAVEALATSEHLPHLAYLLVDDNRLGFEPWQALKPRCRPELLLVHEAISFAHSLARSMTSTTLVENFPLVSRD